MKRRSFLQGGAMAGAAAVLSGGEGMAVQSSVADPASSATKTQREFYLLRRYRLVRAQAAGCDAYLEKAMLPALQRLGFRDVGAFGLEYGPATPTTYLLLRHADPARLVQLQAGLQRDAEFVSLAAPFLSAPAAQPAFDRVDDTLLEAFAGKPLLQVPAKGKRVFQLRTYQSPSMADHLRKVEMFHSGEFEIFAQCGMPAVFYSSTITGEDMPSLTYMLRFDSLADLEAGWSRFRVNPAWKSLSASPRFAGEDLVSRITNLVLSPKPFSGI